MKAAVLTELNKPLNIEEVGLTDLKFGQVLVKILKSGICGSQLHEINGDKGNGKFIPHLMGHEGSAIVIAIGGGVSTVSVGDSVVMHWREGEGVDSDFPEYVYKDKKIFSGKVTTLSQYSIVSENRITKVPSELSKDIAALLGCSLTTAFGIVENEMPNNSNQMVMVNGVGGIGLSVIQAVVQLNRGVVTAVDINPNKEELAMSMGAEDFELIASKKVDVIIDTTGIPSVISNLFELLNPNGTFIMVGQPRPGQSIEIPNALKLFEGSNGKTLRITQGGKTNPTIDIPKYVSMALDGKINVEKLITHRFSLDDINEAFDLLKTGNAGRIMIDIEEG
jgi:2-desacetyl-2-hydroxyethyl bacteriochlorophyllide A dehydrogenase